MRFQGKIGIVAGGASGMGLATVRLLTQEGCKVYVLDVNPTQEAAFMECDVSDYDRVRECVAQIEAAEGRIDVLFVSAGVHLYATIEETSIEEFRRVLGINLCGTFHILKEVLPIMRRQGRGNVVLMGSDQVHVGKGSSSVYGLTKAAIGQLTKSSAIDYAQYNVRVNCICPGTIDTPMLPPTVERFHQSSALSIEEIDGILREAQPIQRLGRPEEIARTVVFMLSDESPYMTGALVNVDGGYTCQ